MESLNFNTPSQAVMVAPQLHTFLEVFQTFTWLMAFSKRQQLDLSLKHIGSQNHHFLPFLVPTFVSDQFASLPCALPGSLRQKLLTGCHSRV